MFVENYREELNKAIDFDRVLEQVASFASFSCSKNEIKDSLPLHDRMEIMEHLDLVKEGLEFVRSGSILNMAGCHDVSGYVAKASKRMILNGKELLDIMTFLVACRSVYNAFDETYPLLNDHARSMTLCTDLVTSIQKQIDMTGSIKEDATPLLKNKHKELIDTRLDLQTRSRSFLKKNNSKLMEAMTTTVSNRLCVLVKAQDKYSFGGMIHGSSQSGLAYYVEPQEFTSLNNRIQMIISEIEEEKQRICKELTKKVAFNSIAISSNLETMTLIDTELAKARWAYRYDGCIPVIQTRDHALLLEHARHPLIDEKKVVANNYTLKSNEYCLMISGPNMGGKTVTLKTVGLFVALSHCGFPVLCHKATIPFYTSMYFDIGDNQSIENNLSTFSSHISKISTICNECDEHSFVLLDEVGNGTDPLQGASLAVAILDFLINKGCTIITSTHYSQVKAFGKANEHILVSSVEFDKDTLKPTYRYIPGVSGASYAFDIAAQYHLNAAILDKAVQFKNENEQNVEKELEKLEKLQNDVLKQKDRFNKLIQDAHRLQKEAAQKQEELDAKKMRFDREYEEKLNDMLEEKRAEAKEIIDELRKQKHQKIHEQTQMMHKINLLGPEKEEEPEANEDLKVGDYVRVVDLNSHGEILDIRKKEATILTNGMKMKIKLSRLKKMPRPQIKKVSSSSVDRVFKRFPLEINLIGMHVEEGLKALDDYLDQAVAHKVKQVRVIHGMGTGKLRNAVWRDLDKHPQVKSKTSAGPSEGGLGATIVVLK